MLLLQLLFKMSVTLTPLVSSSPSNFKKKEKKNFVLSSLKKKLFGLLKSKLCKNQMYENSLFDSKGIFLHEITIKNRYFQDFVKEKL